MKRALVVLEGDESDESLLREAEQYAAGAEAEIIALMTITDEEWENDQDVLATIASEEQTSFEAKSPEEYTRSLAEQVTSRFLAGSDVEYDSVGEVTESGEQATAILDVAKETDCDHVFLHGRRRSPTGKAIFGDTTQSVILNFDGYVTVSTVS